MKLAARDIDGFLKTPANVGGVLIYGPDRGLVRQRMDIIASQILKDLDDPFNRVDLTHEQVSEDSACLLDELAAMSFTGDRRLIVVREASDKISGTIEEGVELLNNQNYLIVWADELGPRSSLRKLAESNAQLAALPCYKDEGMGLNKLIANTLRGYGFRIDEGVVSYLASQLNGDRMIILSELEKISLYFNGMEHIDLSELQTIVSEGGERSFDDICRAVANGQVEALCRTLDRLFLEGVHAVAIVRSVHRYFSRLQEIHTLKAKGQTTEQAVKALRPPVFFKHQSTLVRHADRWSLRKIEHVLHLMLEAEKESKLGGDQSQLLCNYYLMRVARAA